MKDNKGITLVVLIITVILIIIISSIGAVTGIDVIKEMKIQSFEAKMNIIQEKVDLERERYRKLNEIGTINTYIEEKFSDSNYSKNIKRADNCESTSTFNQILGNLYEEDNPNANISNYYYCDSSDLNEYFGIKDIDLNVIINFDSGNIVEKNGVASKEKFNEIYYTLGQIKNNGNPGNGTQYSSLNINNNLLDINSEIIENYGLSKKVRISFNLDESDEKDIPEIRKVYYAIMIENNLEQDLKWQEVSDFERSENNSVDFVLKKSGDYRFKVIGADRKEYISESELEISLCNPPILSEGMEAIYWEKDDETNEYTEITVNNVNNPNWYNYSVTEKRWANAKTQDGSYWVWIPRFVYKTDSETEKIDIKFVNEITNSTTDGVKSTNYKECPCFKNGKENRFSNGEWDKELTGIWVSKYEASRIDATSNNEGTTNELIIRPSVRSFRNIAFSNMFTYCRNMEKSILLDNTLSENHTYGVFDNDKNNIDTHLMKNSEWGAIAYLSWSKYGLNSETLEINTNENYITGGDADINNVYTVRKNQSSTQNLYGIYDLSGGGREVTSAGTNIETFSDDDKSSKYITLYKDEFDKNQILGDAVKETKKSDVEKAWQNEYFNYSPGENPENKAVFFVRGGSINDRTASQLSGLFYNFIYINNPSEEIGFRPVLIVE